MLATRTLESGNQLVILAGTRDVALMQVAEVAANATASRALDQRSGATHAFEALYAVKAMNGASLGGTLTAVYPLARGGL
jgi:hypothetical protein